MEEFRKVFYADCCSLQENLCGLQFILEFISGVDWTL